MPRFAAATVIIAGVTAIDIQNRNDKNNSMRRGATVLARLRRD
jgi:hypothetical protein